MLSPQASDLSLKRRWGAASLLVVSLALASGCRSAERMRARCLEHDQASCLAACDKGVFDEGGCFAAAAASADAALEKPGEPDLAAARKLFVKSCEGGYAPGCIRAAQLVERPYADPVAPSRPGAKPSETQSPALISDAEIAERQRLLQRACEAKSPEGCKRLADVTIGKNDEVALGAYEKACRAAKQAEECVAARRREVAAFEKYREECKRTVADACTALGDLVFRVDVPRAYRLFAAEAELRGVAPLVGGVSRFVALRAREAPLSPVRDPMATTESAAGPREGSPPAATAPASASPSPVQVPGAAPPASEASASHPPHRVALASATIQGRIARSTIERAIQSHERQLAACAEGEPPQRSTVAVELTIDRTGDVWRVKPGEGTAGPGTSACVRTALSEAAFPAPVSGTATVTLQLAFESARSKPPSSPPRAPSPR